MSNQTSRGPALKPALLRFKLFTRKQRCILNATTKFKVVLGGKGVSCWLGYSKYEAQTVK